MYPRKPPAHCIAISPRYTSTRPASAPHGICISGHSGVADACTGRVTSFHNLGGSTSLPDSATTRATCASSVIDPHTALAGAIASKSKSSIRTGGARLPGP